MSDTDSFIDEVSEEVRRDKLFGYLRKYGWIAIVLVVGVVGGAAYNEWSKAQTRAAAQARGDAILTALQETDAEARKTALAGIDSDGNSQAIVALLTSAEALNADDAANAASALQAIEGNADLPPLYRQLATLKRTILTADSTAPADRIAALQPLTAAGGAYRVLAEEQIALAEVEMGETGAALTRLRALQDDAEATAGLLRRVQQLIVALGGDAEPA